MPSKLYSKKIILLVCVIALALFGIGWFATAHRSTCNVAYIQLHGTLVTYVPASEASSTANASDQTGSEDITQSIRDANGDPSIKAIVLEIDSPGGSPVAGEEIELALKGSQKPTVALIRSHGDSAAYLAATGANIIFASTFSDVGDIGITHSYVDNSQQNITNGLTFNQLSIGKYKDMFSPDKPMTADERTLVMSILQNMYRHVVQIVSENRHIDITKATALSSGSPSTSDQALRDGLIDKVGSVDDVQSYLAQKLKDRAVICGIDTSS